MTQTLVKLGIALGFWGALAGAGAHAQQTEGTQTDGPPAGMRPHGPPSPTEELQRLTQALGLTTEQQAAILPILQKRQQEMEALRQSGGGPGADREQMRTIMEQSRASVRALLTQAQQAIFDSMRPPGRGGPGGTIPSDNTSPGDGGPPPGSPQV